jgi:hypothetical protein
MGPMCCCSARPPPPLKGRCTLPRKPASAHVLKSLPAQPAEVANRCAARPAPRSRQGVIKKGETYPTHLPKAELRGRFLDRCHLQCRISRGAQQARPQPRHTTAAPAAQVLRQLAACSHCPAHSHAVTVSCHAAHGLSGLAHPQALRKGQPPCVSIGTEKRMGSKKVTRVAGLEAFLVDLEAVSCRGWRSASIARGKLGGCICARGCVGVCVGERGAVLRDATAHSRHGSQALRQHQPRAQRHV